jgi:hypothetical protein
MNAEEFYTEQVFKDGIQHSYISLMERYAEHKNNETLAELRETQTAYEGVRVLHIQAQKQADQQSTRIKQLEDALSSALRIKDIWLIADSNCPPEHLGEAKALQAMEAVFLEALKSKQ